MEPLHHHPAFDVPLAGDTAVIACHFNPSGYQRPRANLRAFLDRLAAQSVPVFMMELTYGEARPFLPAGPRVQHLRTAPDNLLFHKENLLNLTERIVPAQFTKVVWLDAECLLHRADWLSATSAALDAQPVVQPWHRGIITNAAGREVALLNSTGHGASLNDHRRCYHGYGNPYHPGFATAARRELWTQHGGLYELPVSCGDTAMAMAIQVVLTREQQLLPGVSPAVWSDLCRWSARVRPWAGGIGCIRGDITHLWHGDLDNRNYAAQPGLLRAFDPARHIQHRADGLLEWSPFARAEIPVTIAAIAALFSARKEDG